MSDSISLKQVVKQAQSLKQTQQLMLTPQMQQAIKILQMPVLEVLEAIEQEMESNPILEYDEEKILPPEERESTAELANHHEETPLTLSENDYSSLETIGENFTEFFESTYNTNMRQRAQKNEGSDTYRQSLIRYEPTLYDHLNRQASEIFGSTKNREVAEVLIGYIDKRGFLDTKLEEIAALHSFPLEAVVEVAAQIKEFEPSGVGASDLQEALQIQLRRKAKGSSLAFRIVTEQFQELLHNRIPEIAKKLGTSNEVVYRAIRQDLLPLYFYPGNSFGSEISQRIVADLAIEMDGEQLRVVANEKEFPVLRLRKEYLQMAEKGTLSREDKEFILQKYQSAQWLLRNLFERGRSLELIGQCLVKHQGNFLLGNTEEIVPLTMKQVAEELHLNESTISRAVSGKYIFTPRGLYPLNYFFSGGLPHESGEEVSTRAVKELMLRIIEKENKEQPHSDQAIVELMQKAGISCARRTVAKYRNLLHLGNKQQRKQY